jgi:hypothetical protein
MARRAVCANNLKQIGLAMIAYSSDTDLLPCYGGVDPTYTLTGFNGNTPKDNEEHPFVAYRGDESPWKGPPPVPMRLACLYARHFIADPKLFYCPSNRNPQYMYKSYVNPGRWGEFPQNYNSVQNKNQWLRLGYDYYPIDETAHGQYLMVEEGEGSTMVPKVSARRFSQLSRSSPYASDGIWDQTDISHKSGIEMLSGKVHIVNGGINAVFKDAHVRFVKDEPVTYQVSVISPVVTNRTVFSNYYWENWAPTDSQHDFRLIYYNIYNIIKP